MTVIVAALRTPIGKFGGQLAGVSAPDLGAVVIQALLARTGIEANAVDEVLMGNLLQAGLGQGPARQAAIRAGLPHSVPATAINMLCGSGLKSVQLGAALIDTGQADIVIAGGMENMSAAPYLLPHNRWGQRIGNGEVLDSMLNDALIDAFDGCHMGVTAETLAAQYRITRTEQDAFACRSQHHAVLAMQAGVFTGEIVPVTVASKKGEQIMDADEGPRPDTSIDKLAGLAPAFAASGTVTAGNASTINDGAAAVLLMSETRARELGLTPMARIVAAASTGVDPKVMGIGPVSAIERVLAQSKVTLADVNLIELNEAFAAQSLAVCRALDLNTERVNVHGGAIALGHPVGASGARILVTLLHSMQRQKADVGLASLCVGGGMGVAMLVEQDSN